MSKPKNKKLSGIKPIVKDGHHYRWYYHLSTGWQIVEVSPWNNYQCCFDRHGFKEDPNHWVKNTYPWQWGPKIELQPTLDPNHKIPNWVFNDQEKVIKSIRKVISLID